MSKLIVTEFISLNGVIEAPGGEPTYPHTGWTVDFTFPEPGSRRRRAGPRSR
ncbi:MAG TPA: hypothetical protein VFF07_11450 [Actinomycetota bacterium]|nr:hypothetical protein [Actinomycetota bacterium]